MAVGNCTRSSDTLTPPVAGRSAPSSRLSWRAWARRSFGNRGQDIGQVLNFLLPRISLDAGQEGNCVRLRLTGAVLVLLGLVAAGTAVASATLWRPADHILAEALASGATTMIVTDPGVLELGDETVAVRATAPAGARVVAVVGRESDVRAWVGQDAYTRVTGLADAATLATTAGEPVVVPSPSPSASPSD